MTSAEYYSPYFISARTAEIVYNSEARNRKIEQHTINKFMLSGQPKEVGCRVRGILLGGPAWVRGVLCEGQNYDYPIKPPHAGPEHILQRVLVKYSVDGRTRRDWFYLRWGEVWFDGKPMPVITDSDEWLRDLILHRLVFAPLVTELRVPHASRYNPDLSPTCTYTENRLIYFPAFFEEEGDVECNPGRFARRAWSVRFLYLYGGVEQPVWYHERTVIPAAGAHNLLIPDEKLHELLIPASPSVLLVFDIPFLPSSDAWILAPAQLTGRLRNLYVDDYGYPHPPFIDGPLSLCDGSS